ncbi:hypothetical protein BDY19DRAFT_964333 [Irpex rosettiformis]|uniref:Uncharacterized protein n=1 Tax=Irpex rosettiformis TaxID=378272 RepID=A0ACB8TV34_9APHY|nr:hypothetical protein BDY19DRAFT_964333 [Irpex rosettiformis]
MSGAKPAYIFWATVVIAKIERRAEDEVIFDEATILGLLFVEAAADSRACVDDVDEEQAVHDGLVLDVLWDSVNRVLDVLLCAAVRVSATSVGTWRRERKEKINSV